MKDELLARIKAKQFSTLQQVRRWLNTECYLELLREKDTDTAFLMSRIYISDFELFKVLAG